MKCSICNSEIQTQFLGKILGTHIKDEKGKRHVVCFECQKKIGTKPEMLKKMK